MLPPGRHAERGGRWVIAAEARSGAAACPPPPRLPSSSDRAAQWICWLAASWRGNRVRSFLGSAASGSVSRQGSNQSAKPLDIVGGLPEERLDVAISMSSASNAASRRRTRRSEGSTRGASVEVSPASAERRSQSLMFIFPVPRRVATCRASDDRQGGDSRNEGRTLTLRGQILLICRH